MARLARVILRGTAVSERMAVAGATNRIAGLRGERLPHCVNPEVYEHESRGRR